MKKWLVLFRKEWLEMIRSYKIIWLPVSFILLGASQPITTYFMPDILSSAGNLPEGAVITIPTPKPFEVLASALQQFGVIGLLLIALSTMGALSLERSSGTAAMILVKPVSFGAFVTAKWVAILGLCIISFVFGFSVAWYYTAALFGPVEWQSVVLGALLFALWLGFVGTLAFMFSSFIRSAAAAAFSSLAAAAILSISSSTLPYKQVWNPGRLPSLAAGSLDPAQPFNDNTVSILVTAAITAAVIAAALVIATSSIRSKPSDV